MSVKSTYHVNLPIHVIRQVIMYPLVRLENGLVICEVKIANSPPIKCNALIDTGAEISVICKSIFKELKTIDKNKIERINTRSINSESENDIVYPLKVRIPYKNYCCKEYQFVIKDLTKREEYKMIIGVDILQDFVFMYDGMNEKAWLQA
jgi:hypothetical protein